MEALAMKHLLLFPLALASLGAAAETPRQLLDAYAAEAAKQQAGFRPQAGRGGSLYAQRFGVSATLPACVTCHGDDPAKPGRHAVTGKDIKPLAPAANAERLADAAKVEKWFRRNCKEVVGRECVPAEKADFIAFLTEGRGS
jgi:cytochrome c553